MMTKTTIANKKTDQLNNLKFRSSSNDRGLIKNDFKNFSINQNDNDRYLNKSKLNENFENFKQMNYNLLNSNFQSKDSKQNLFFSSASSLFNLADPSNHHNKRNNETKIIDKENLLNSYKKISSSSNNLNFSNKNILFESNLPVSNHSCSDKNNSDYIKYGELIVLGYNGYINPITANLSSFIKMNDLNNINRRKSKYILKRRDKANGVKPFSQHNCQSFQEVNNLIAKNHSVTYTMSRNHTVVVQYVRDEKTDMFQIGRSSENAIDFIVLDTVVSNVQNSSPISSLISNNQNKHSSQQKNSQSEQHILNNNNNNNQQSTISRFSCRICVEREYPYTARIYAAGFDSSNSIFLGEKATKWKNDKGELDGVTTNGVLIMHPTDGFTSDDSKTNEWMEVSVCGAVFSLNESRLTPCLVRNTNMKDSSNRSNILRDGTLIDLCGATLMWRSVQSLKNTPTKHFLDMNLENLNRIRPQCPVGLKTLIFPSSASPITNQTQSSIFPNLDNLQNTNSNYFHTKQPKHSIDRIPMVYLKCGHVHGHHDWGIKKDNERECPLCRKIGPYVKLLMGLEPSLYNDTNLTLFKPFAFRPCGHMASESTCKYWSKILVPQGTTQGLSSICPFCAFPLCKEQPFVKLIFQEGV